MESSVQVRCKRCKGVFRERARRLQSGYSRQCPSCEVVIFFDEASGDDNIKRAMNAARRLRAALREADALGAPDANRNSSTRTYGGRTGRGAREHNDDVDDGT
jgi:predicted  nucleic acid-binding Zn-ribbon protein